LGESTLGIEELWSPTNSREAYLLFDNNLQEMADPNQSQGDLAQDGQGRSWGGML